MRFHNAANPDRPFMMKLSDVENFTNLDQVRNAFSLNTSNKIDAIIKQLRIKDILFITYEESLTYGDYISILSKLRNRKNFILILKTS